MPVTNTDIDIHGTKLLVNTKTGLFYVGYLHSVDLENFSICLFRVRLAYLVGSLAERSPRVVYLSRAQKQRVFSGNAIAHLKFLKGPKVVMDFQAELDKAVKKPEAPRSLAAALQAQAKRKKAIHKLNSFGVLSRKFAKAKKKLGIGVEKSMRHTAAMPRDDVGADVAAGDAAGVAGDVDAATGDVAVAAINASVTVAADTVTNTDSPAGIATGHDEPLPQRVDVAAVAPSKPAHVPTVISNPSVASVEPIDRLRNFYDSLDAGAEAKAAKAQPCSILPAPNTIQKYFASRASTYGMPAHTPTYINNNNLQPPASAFDALTAKLQNIRLTTPAEDQPPEQVIPLTDGIENKTFGKLYYNPTKSFYDNISTKVNDKNPTRLPAWRVRELNALTFGDELVQMQDASVPLIYRNSCTAPSCRIPAANMRRRNNIP